MGMVPSYGKDLSFKINILGSSTAAIGEIVDISRHVMSVDGLPGEREMADVTCGGGADAHEWLNGMFAANFSLQCLLDQTTEGNYASAWKTLCNYSTDTASRYFAFAPGSTTTGYPNITGRAWIKDIVLPSKPLDPLVFTCNLALDSTISVTTC